MATRKQNERKFGNWAVFADDGRRYWHDFERNDGFRIRYVKVVDANETITAVVQELYNPAGNLVEIHEKFPVDRGHRKV